MTPFQPRLRVRSIASMTLAGKPKVRTTFCSARVMIANAGREAGWTLDGRRGAGMKLWRFIIGDMVEHGPWLGATEGVRETRLGFDRVVIDCDGGEDMNMSEDAVL